MIFTKCYLLLGFKAAAYWVETKHFKFGRTMQLFNVCHEEKCKMYSIHTLVHEKLSNWNTHSEKRTKQIYGNWTIDDQRLWQNTCCSWIQFNWIELQHSVSSLFPIITMSTFHFFFFSATLIFFHANIDYLWFICMFQPLIESFHANCYFFGI